MKVLITRTACCSQDDQLGPLDIQLEVNEDATFEELMQKIIKINFLQYSSSDHMVGIVGSKKIVEIFLRQERVVFHTEKDNLAKDLINGSELSFYFIEYFLNIEKEKLIKNKSNQDNRKNSLLQKLFFWKRVL